MQSWFCTLTHDILLTPLDAGELEYAQVGDRVTINCPWVMNSKDYLYWKLDGLELAWINRNGIISVTAGEQRNELFVLSVK